MIKVDLSKAKLAENMDTYKEQVASIHDMIHNKTGKGNDFLGWVDLPVNYDKAEAEAIKAKAAELRKEVDVLLVCGIGGSYLGARAAIEAINGLFPTNDVQIIYVGNTFSSNYLAQVKEYVKDKEFAINVISKSGTTTETSIAFRIFKDLLETTKGKDVAQRRIVATTDKEKGALKTLANNEGYTTFVVPDDVGGRYSVLTAVGLFPIAMAGIDIDAMMKGAADAREKYNTPNLSANDAYQYAVARQVYQNRDTLPKCLSLMNYNWLWLLNGGNNYLENQKVKKVKEFYQQVQLSQLIYIHLVSSFKKEQKFYMKQSLRLKNQLQI